MKIKGRQQEFIVIGENIHTTRVVLRRGKNVSTTPDGQEAVYFINNQGKKRFLIIPENRKNTQDYLEGRVKHIGIAVEAAMNSDEELAAIGVEYLELQIQRQLDSGADFLDINVDEISIREQGQQDAMLWLTAFVQDRSSVPLCVDSSNSATIEVGLKSCNNHAGKPMLNSASLERISALDLVRKYDCKVIVSAAGASGMPNSAEERIDNASRMVDRAIEMGINACDIFIDPLMFPISVDQDSCNHVFEAIRHLRQKYGPEIHISGGFSNVSFGLPCRRLINDVFFVLAIEAGADSGIIDPFTSNPSEVFLADRSSAAFQYAQAMLQGQDADCKEFLKAYRKKLLLEY